jgi:hypothetical protein
MLCLSPLIYTINAPKEGTETCYSACLTYLLRSVLCVCILPDLRSYSTYSLNPCLGLGLMGQVRRV